MANVPGLAQSPTSDRTHVAVVLLASGRYRAGQGASVVPRFGRPSLDGMLPRLGATLAQLFAGVNLGESWRIVARAFAAFLPLLDVDSVPTATDEQIRARVDLLRLERQSRAHLVRLATSRARPDRPPEVRSFPAIGSAWAATPQGSAWNAFLDLISEALEIYLRAGHRRGVASCADLLDLLADTFAELPDAA